MLTILLSEDEDAVAKTVTRRLTRLFKKRGTEFTLHRATNGYEAVDLAWQHQPELVLMDMRMPKMDGYEAVQALRGDGYEGKIIALTASVTRGEESKSKEMGCDGVIRKPIASDFEDRVLTELGGSTS